MIEKELKILLTEEEYLSILSDIEWESSFEQINHYYSDPDGAQKGRGLSIRIRELNNKFYLQMKRTITERGLLHVKEEYEYEMISAPDILSNLTLRDITIKNAKKMGCLKTIRHIYHWDKNTEICLDENMYLGTKDYEIEIEFTKGIPASLSEWLQKTGLNLNGFAPGKYSRFCSIYFSCFNN